MGQVRVFGEDITSTKYVIYMRLGYELQKSRKSFLNAADVRGNRLIFDMYSYNDNNSIEGFFRL